MQAANVAQDLKRRLVMIERDMEHLSEVHTLNRSRVADEELHQFQARLRSLNKILEKFSGCDSSTKIFLIKFLREEIDHLKRSRCEIEIRLQQPPMSRPQSS